MASDKDDKKPKDDEAKGGGKKKLIIMVVAALVVVGAAYFLFLKPKPDAAAAGGKGKPTAAAEASHEPGAVLQLEKTTVNLAESHFLSFTLALQLSKTAGAEVSGAKATDIAIGLYSNKPLDEVTDPKGRDRLKAELVEKLTEAYEGEVYDVYFTDYVAQ